ncbi:rho guanine nucleotide exchange factor 5 isoform X2 [Pseudonaja textilis]|nr:rho guanine nucleotide exchange factor 5 isoform X2 [Pseudonaja textilis]
MESEPIQERDPFPRSTHRTHEASNPSSARKYHDVTEAFVMSQVPGSEEVEEKEDPSLSHDLALLLVMKEHMWDGSSNSTEEKDTSQDLERKPREVENWEEFSGGKQDLNRGQLSLKESQASSLNSFDGEFASYSSTSCQSVFLDTTSPVFSPPRKVSAGQMESCVGDGSFGQPPSLRDTHSQTWHEKSAMTNTLPCQEDSTSESPLVIHNISNCHESADFYKSWSDEEHSWQRQTQHTEDQSLGEETDVATRINEISSKREQASKRFSNPSSEEDEFNLDGVRRKGGNVLFQVSSKEGEEHSGVEDEIGDSEENVLSRLVLQLQEEEESDVRVSNPFLLKKNIQTNDNISNVNCEESESDQKQLSTTRKPEFTESGPLELAGREEEGGRDLNEKAAKSKSKTNLEEVQLPHNDHEEQEWAVQATIDPMPIRSGQGTFDSLENSLALSGLNDNSSEEFAFPLKEVSSPDHSPTSGSVWPEPCVQTLAIAFPGMTPESFQPGSGSPRPQSALYHNSGQVEHSGIYDEANTTSCCDQESAQPTVRVGKEDVAEEDVGKEENVSSADGEQITQLFADVALGNASQDLHGSQVVGGSSGAENNPVPSLRTITATLLQEDPSKGATDGTVTCAGEGSVLHFSSQLDREIGDEASALDRDGEGHLPAFGEDFVEGTQSSTSKAPPNPSLEEGLSNIAKEMIKLSLSSWGSVQDTTEDNLKSHQQLKPTIQNALFSGKEAAADTDCTEKDILASESPCFSVLGKEGTECDYNADSLSSSRTLFAITTDAAQLTQPLASVLVGDPEQNLVLESASLLSSAQPLQFVIPPPEANFNAQPTPTGLNPDRLLEQRASSCQVNPLAPKSSANETVLEYSPLGPETRSSEPLSTSEGDLDQCCQVPRSVQNFKQSVLVSRRASLPIVSRRSGFPSLASNAASQRTNSKQITPSVAAGPTQPPYITVSRGSHSSRSNSNSRKHLLVRDNPSTQHRTEASENNAHAFRTGSEEPTHLSPPVSRHACWDSSSICKRGDLVLDNKMEEISGLPLATCPELGLSLSDLQGEFLGNGATGADCFLSVPERISKFEDMPDGRSSHYTFHPLGDRENPRETKSRNGRQPPSLLAFTNPIHFLQLGPPSPSSDPYPGEHQEPPWPEQQARNSGDPVASLSEGPGRLRKVFEKSAGEPICLAVHRKGLEGRHQRLEKSSSCPDKNTIGLGTKESTFGTKKQEAGAKQRAKSKDWHRHGLRKISIPTDGAVEVSVASLHSKEEAAGPKDRANHLDIGKYGEKKTPETLENIKRRCSKLINSSKLLYQEYSDDALNKAIQSQKQADSLSEEAEPISPKLRKKVPISQDSYLHRLSVSSGSSLWQDIPMVRGSTMLLSMTREEQKLQEAKFELIASEASYLRSLNVAVDHFQRSQELQGVLTTQDKQWLFSRLQDVRDVSANFLFELEEKLEENMFTFNVCDVALRNAPEFRRVYLPYVTNQTYQDQTFQRLMNGVPAFQQVLEKLESDPVCQRLSLKSFLILPFQRITRLKLLLQNILKRIPPGADEEVQATQAYDALEKLIKDCNANVQRMKSTEELIHLSQNMEFECKIFPLISQSRRLVKHGELTALEYNISLKWKLTTRPIYLHLFNDYLLLSRPRENGRFIVFDHAASSDVRGEKCEMKLHGDNKNLFRLFLLQNNQGKKVEFLFRTETQSEKLRWISALMPQQPEPDLLDDSDAPQVQCVKSYKAREHDELTLEKADIVMVLRSSSDGWREGVKLSDGERGWFPLDHVETISSKQVRQMNLKEEQRVKNAKQQVFRRR